jgi:hypothetical protein
MEDMMEIRKQDSELKLSDLERFPAWEYALEEESIKTQDERTVRPYLEPSPLDPTNAYLLVRASFHLSNGVTLKGFIKPIALGNPRFMEPLLPVDLRPEIVAEQGHVAFWYGSTRPRHEDIARNYMVLGYETQSIFPISFESDIELLNSISAGILEGFLYCEPSVRDFFHLSAIDIRAVR